MDDEYRGDFFLDWDRIGSERQRPLSDELAREVSPGHPLFGLPAVPVAKRVDQDEFLFALEDGSRRVAQVHLTWKEGDRPPFPTCQMFDGLTEWSAAAQRYHEYSVRGPDE